MAAVTRNIVLARCPELASIPDGVEWTDALADAQDQVDDAVWGSRAERATCYVTGHLLALAFPGKVSSGPLQAFSAGAVSKSYAVATAQWRNRFDETKFGRLYNDLCDSLPAARGIVL